MTKPERIAKVIARSGLCSRREAERWIEEGRVKVNGAVIDSPALNISGSETIEINGRALPQPDRTRLLLFHKPAGVLTSRKDPEGRPTIFTLLPADFPHLHPVGRLDLNSEGLLLLTNDGDLKRKLELPATGLLRTYRVRAFGHFPETMLASLRNGVSVEGIHYGPMEVSLEKTEGRNRWLKMGLKEGKNREIRKVLEHFGCRVNRLIRLSYGPFHLGKLARGEWMELPQQKLKLILKEL